jgi:hypothetical protein
VNSGPSKIEVSGGFSLLFKTSWFENEPESVVNKQKMDKQVIKITYKIILKGLMQWALCPMIISPSLD